MADYAALIRPTRFSQLLGLAINHFPRDQLILEMRIPVNKAAPLLFALRPRGLNSFDGFKELFKSVGHDCNISDSGDGEQKS
jgi:hypothetical protein